MPKNKKKNKLQKRVSLEKQETKNKKSKTSVLSLLILAVIVIYALIYSIHFVGGPSFFGDDTVYASLANSVISGGFMESSFIFSVRLLQIYPIALFYKLFGISLFTDSAWDILSFLGMIIVTFFIGKELYNEYAGIISALLLSFFPLVVQLSATISDDIPMAFISSLAILSIVLAKKHNSKKWYFAAGILLLASPLVTPEGFIIIIIAAVYLLIELFNKTIKIDRTTLYLVYGFIIAGIMLMAANSVLSGNPPNPFITMSLSTHFYSKVGGNDTIPSTDTNPMFYISTMFPYNLIQILKSNIVSYNLNPINIWKQIYVINYNNVGFYFYAALLASIYLLIRREKSANIVLVWLFVGFLYLEFGPMGISLHPLQYILSYRLQRFLTLIAVPTVLVIGISLAKFTNCDSKKYQNSIIYFLKFGLAALIVIFLIATAIPVNMMWWHILYYERYDQLIIANYLSTLPDSTSIYMSSAFSNVPVYMGFNNMQRIHIYDEIQNCRDIPSGTYIIMPKSQKLFNLNYTPNPEEYCPEWKLVLDPETNINFPQYITSVAAPFEAELYYYASNNNTDWVNATNNQGSNSTNNSIQHNLNYFNLTGVGYYNNTLHRLTYFYTVNNVSNVTVNISRNNAYPGENLSVHVLFSGNFDWTGSNQSTYYLSSPLINVHYFGIELANQTGKLLDQNNGPWYKYITIGQPSQSFDGSVKHHLMITWNISPTNYSSGKELKVCAGYFATYQNTTILGGWGPAFNILSSNQTRTENYSIISTPSDKCVYLSVS
jgi:hypothetical protein